MSKAQNTKKPIAKTTPKKVATPKSFGKYPDQAVDRMIKQIEAGKRHKDILKDFAEDCAK